MLNWEDAAELTRKLKKNDSTSTSIGESFLVVLFVVGFIAIVGVPLLTYFVWSHALVIKTFWAWFVVSTFDLQPLTWAQAWGLSMIVSYMTHHNWTKKHKDDRENSEKYSEFAMLCFKPWIALGIGYICAHYFMKVI